VARGRRERTINRQGHGGIAGERRENVQVPRSKTAAKIDVKLLLASFGIALGVVFIVLGINSSVTGREQQQLPDAIEDIAPIRGATQVPQQSQLLVDLQPGYSARLTVNGVELEIVSLADLGFGTSVPEPGAQVDLPKTALLEPGNNSITYTPVEGGPIEQFEPGSNSATVIYWRTIEGPSTARSYTWLFTVV